MATLKERLLVRLMPGPATESDWSEVLLHPEQVPRHRAWCHRCGSFGVTRTGRMRVRPIEGADVAGHYTRRLQVPRSIVVPMCGGCRHGGWIGVLGVILLGFVGLALGMSEHGQVNDPVIEVPRWAKPIVEVTCLVAFFVIAAASFGSRFHIAFDGAHLRYAFRDAYRAAEFASDNGAAEAKAPPERATAEHDPDGVDHSGLHADAPDGDD